jgi:hypothetical protein
MSIIGEILIGGASLVSLIIAKTRIVFRGNGLSCSFNDHHADLDARHPNQHISEHSLESEEPVLNTVDELIERKSINSSSTLPPRSMPKDLTR